MKGLKIKTWRFWISIIKLFQISAPELIGGVSGESEERIRELFDRAVESAPCVLFIDEVDAIMQNRQNAQREMERRIVAQLLTCLDGWHCFFFYLVCYFC